MPELTAKVYVHLALLSTRTSGVSTQCTLPTCVPRSKGMRSWWTGAAHQPSKQPHKITWRWTVSSATATLNMASLAK